MPGRHLVSLLKKARPYFSLKDSEGLTLTRLFSGLGGTKRQQGLLLRGQNLVMTKPSVVFVLGRPGSGKGTQCTKISETYGFVHLSAGDLLREEWSDPQSEYGAMIETHIKNGTIVPVEVTCALIENAMKRSGGTAFLIDGFPRSQDNLEGWEREMARKVDLRFVLYFDCPQEECVRRCLERGEAGSGRSDDNPASLEKRVVTYSTATEPIIKHFMGLDLVRTVEAAADVNTVFSRVQTVFEAAGFKRILA